MRYRCAIFDMDGTILNTLEDLADSTNAALSLSGYPERSIDEVRSFVGNGIRLLIERAVPEGISVAETDRVHADFMKYYQVHCADKTRPYDGIRETIAALQRGGCQTAVVSNKADAAVRELSSRYFDGLFSVSIGEREGIARKPAPDTVNEVMRRLGVSRKETVYIGDSEVDLETAENAKLPCILVEWGFRDKEFLRSRGGRTFVAEPEQIAQLILG